MKTKTILNFAAVLLALSAANAEAQDYEEMILNAGLTSRPSSNLDSNRVTTVHVKNESGVQLDLKWMDFEGTAQPWGTIEAGETRRIATSQGHVFHIYNGTNPRANFFVGEEAIQYYTVKRSLEDSRDGSVAPPLPASAGDLLEIVFTDRAGRTHTLKKEGHLWSGTHPNFDRYGLSLRRNRNNDLPDHVIELGRTGAGTFLNLKIDIKEKTISHSTLAPWRAEDGSGGINYRYEGTNAIVSFR